MNIRLHVLRGSATLASREEGNSIIETALVLPVLLLMLAGAVDIGRAFRASMILNDAAQTGAAYGVHNPTDLAGMAHAANVDTSKLITVVPTATYGCECSDGTHAIASCASEPPCSSSINSVYYVELDATATYTPILPWPGVRSTIPLSAKVRLRASR